MDSSAGEGPQSAGARSPRKEILRSSLVRRIAGARAEIVSIVAPAGYGKSMLARQLASRQPLVVDCGNFAGCADLNARIVRAVAEAQPDAADRLAQYELATSSAGSSELNVTLAAIRLLASDRMVIFENAEGLSINPGSTAVLEHLLAASRGHQIVICSRAPLAVRLHRFARLENIVRLGPGDLRFDRSEIAELLRDFAPLMPNIVERIEAISAGWPIVVQVLRSCIRQGTIDDVLNAVGGLGLEDVREYLLDEVLSTLSPLETDALVLCAALPGPSEAELVDVLGHGSEGTVAALVANSPFVARRMRGVLDLHPILRAVVRSRHSERCDAMLRAAIERARQRGDRLREATLRIEIGDQREAAAVLEPVAEHLVLGNPSVEYAQVVARFERAVLLDHPRLWASTLLFGQLSRSRSELLRDARIVWQKNRDCCDLEVFVSVCSAFLTVTAVVCGERTEAQAALRAFEQRVASDAGGPAALVLQAWQAALAALDGRNGQALDIWDRIAGAFVGFDTALALSEHDIVARVARCRGERELERAALASAWEAALRSGVSVVRAVVLINVLFGTWLAGEECTEAATMLGQVSDPSTERLLRPLLDSFRGMPIAEGTEHGPLRAWAYANLMAIPFRGDVVAARQCAQRALEIAESAAQPFLQVLAHVALAALSGAERMTHLGKARQIAAKLESPRLHRALFKMQSGEPEYGMLDAYVRRILARMPHDELEVSVLKGRLRYRDSDVALTNRELEVLSVLAIERRALTLAELAARIDPEREVDKFSNQIKVTIHRMREKLGPRILLTTGRGYDLGVPVRVDLQEVQQLLLGMVPAIDPATLREQSALLTRVGRQLLKPDVDARWNWLLPLTLELRRLLHEQIALVGRGLAELGEGDAALELARVATVADPCDEAARETAVAAHLKMGNRAAALREFREYQAVLRQELDATPGPYLARMIAESA